MSCLDGDTGEVIYNSNILQSQFQSAKSFNSLFAVSVTPSISVDSGAKSFSQSKISLSADVYSASLKSCSFNVYLKTKVLNSKGIDSISVIPLSFSVDDYAQQFLSKASLKGFISMKSNSPIPQSSILSVSEANLYSSSQ